MSNTLIQAGGTLRDLSPIEILPGSPEEANLHARSYDFNAGDRRFVDHEEAVQWANIEAAKTGIRQMIRINGSEPGAHGRPLYLVQAVGS